MRCARPLFAITVVAFILATPAHLAAQFQPVTIQIAETAHPVIIKLHPDSETSGGYNSISVRISDSLQFSFATMDSMQLPSAADLQEASRGLLRNLAGFKLDPSRYFFQAVYGPATHRHTLLLFVGPDDVKSGNHIFLIAFKPDATPYEVLNDNISEIASLTESTNGIEITARTSPSQVIAGSGDAGDNKPYAMTYAPYSVFVMTSGEPATYSLAKSEAYNRAHYVWAGKKGFEDFAVLYNVPAHPHAFAVQASKVPDFIK